MYPPWTKTSHTLHNHFGYFVHHVIRVALFHPACTHTECLLCSPLRSIAVYSAPCILSPQYDACKKNPPLNRPSKNCCACSLSETYNVQSLFWDLQRTVPLRPTTYRHSETYNVQSLRDLQRTAILRPTTYSQSVWNIQHTVPLRPTTYRILKPTTYSLSQTYNVPPFWDLKRKSLWDLQRTAILRPTTYS